MSGVGIWVVLPKNVEVLYLDKNSPQYEWIWDLGGLAKKCGRNMSGFGIWVVLPKNVEALYLHKNSPQYEWIWDLGGLAKKCGGIIPQQK
jgi:hypothetical protein